MECLLLQHMEKRAVSEEAEGLAVCFRYEGDSMERDILQDNNNARSLGV